MSSKTSNKPELKRNTIDGLGYTNVSPLFMFNMATYTLATRIAEACNNWLALGDDERDDAYNAMAIIASFAGHGTKQEHVKAAHWSEERVSFQVVRNTHWKQDDPQCYVPAFDMDDWQWAVEIMRLTFRGHMKLQSEAIAKAYESATMLGLIA